MKILIISDAWHPQVNGVVRTYEYLNKTLEAQGHEVCVFGPAEFKYRFAMPGYKEIELVPMPYARLKRKIENFAPDMIHIATEGPLGWGARKFCLRTGRKFTTSYHTQFPDYVARRLCYFIPCLYPVIHRLGVKMIRKFHAPSTAMLVTTKSMSDQLQQWGIKTPIFPFTRGIDTALFHPGKKKLFDDLTKPVALYVGRLAIEKNIEEFLSMPWQGSKVIVGHGPDKEMLQKKYPSAYFVGKKFGEELADHYRSADVFVFPSTTDTFGIVLIEALACGLPIAAHDAIGPRDVVVNDKLGALDNNLEKAAEQAMKKGCAQERHDYIKENYTWEKAAEQFLTAKYKTLE